MNVPVKTAGQERGRDRTRRGAAFTLLEMLVAITILFFIGVILASILGFASHAWQRGEGDNQNRQRARIALDTIRQEMRVAALPLNRTNSISLQFVVNPSSVGSSYRNHDTIFWQAPIATDTSQGDMAEVGYFVRYVNNKPSLCRFFVNPTDSNYIENNPGAWLSSTILDSVAPADQGDQYRGLFLENVLGLWVQAYNQDGSAYGGDSRTSGTLPSWVDLSLVLIDDEHAQRIATPILSSSFSSATTFVASLPATIQPGVSIVNMKVSLVNATGTVPP